MNQRGILRRTAAQILAGDSLAVVAILAFGPAAIGKLAGDSVVVMSLGLHAFPEWAAVAWGLFELSCLGLTLFPRTQHAAVVLLTANVAAAIALQVAEPTAILAIALHLAAWSNAAGLVPQPPFRVGSWKSVRAESQANNQVNRTMTMPPGVVLEV